MNKYSSTVWHNTLAGENFGGVGAKRILAEKALAVGRGKAHSIFELTRPDNFLVDQILAIFLPKFCAIWYNYIFIQAYKLIQENTAACIVNGLLTNKLDTNLISRYLIN